MTDISENNGKELFDAAAAEEEVSVTQEAEETFEGAGQSDQVEKVDGGDQVKYTARDETTAAAEPELEETASGKRPQRSHLWERWLLFIVAGVIVVFDQYSKSLVESALDLYTYWAPFPNLEYIFRITHVSNTGVAFGLFQNGNTIFTILAIIVSIAIVIYNARLEGGHKMLRLALGLQMGGALGNMIDRLRQGYVTDFMDFGPWPVWNLADLAIVSGTVLLVLIMFQEERREKQSAEEAAVGDEQFGKSLETSAPQIDERQTS